MPRHSAREAYKTVKEQQKAGVEPAARPALARMGAALRSGLAHSSRREGGAAWERDVAPLVLAHY